MSMKKWFDNAFQKQGLKAQRKYPNEEMIRFMAKYFFHLPQNQREITRILEVGCGSLANLIPLYNEGYEVYGIDISSECVKLCQEFIFKNKLDGIKITCQNMMNLKFDEEFFHCVLDVFSSYVLNEKELIIYLKNIYQKLKPNGLYFSYFPSKNSHAFINHHPSNLTDNSTINGIKRLNSPYTGNLYNFGFRYPLEYKNILEKIGFSVLQLETITKTYNNMSEKFEFISIVGRK